MYSISLLEICSVKGVKLRVSEGNTGLAYVYKILMKSIYLSRKIA